MRTKPKESPNQEPGERLRVARDEFFARVARKSHPAGDWQDGLWEPAPQEVRPCCAAIRPSTANRQALESHCRSQAHVAALFEVPLPDLKAAVKAERIRQAGSQENSLPEQDFSRIVRDVRQFSTRQLRQQIEMDLPPIKRLRDLGIDEDLPALLDLARRAAERLLMAIKVAQTMEVGLKDLNLVFAKPNPKDLADSVAPKFAGRDDRRDQDSPPRRAFEASGVRAA